MGKVEGKHALVTGGNSGFITGRREEELAAAVKEIGKCVTGI